MDEITLKDFRCFHGEQTARLAPLTLLVGDNSTGKTSFLAAVRALWDTVHKQQVPNFKEPPYDLGTFPELVHNRGGRDDPATAFAVGFSASVPRKSSSPGARMEFRMKIKQSRGVPVLHSRSLANGAGVQVTEFPNGGANRSFRMTTPNGSWNVKMPEMPRRMLDLPFDVSMRDLGYVLMWDQHERRRSKVTFQPVSGTRKVTEADKEIIGSLLVGGGVVTGGFAFGGKGSSEERRWLERPIAGAPVRSRPRRIYEPTNLEQDAEGDYIPMYLADLRVRGPDQWARLKEKLEEFGSDAGLFDEIGIKSLGDNGGTGFLVQVRKFSGPRSRVLKGPQRNLIDVGYGVSQILPVATELLRQDAPRTFLLQQPEVHLHPSAQAALGSLFGRAVGEKKHQLVVETHSDYLLDRVRMLIRRRKTRVKPEDVSILFFEREGLGVRIHSLRLDEQGGVQDAPEGYRRFFMEEFDRLFGLEDARDS